MPLPEPIRQIDRTYVLYRGRKLSYFAGCDYFRLASHPAVLKAAHTGLNRYGLSVSASRKTTGNHAVYSRLEAALASFFGRPAALVVSTGYLANLVTAQALAGEFTHAFIDAQAHPSLQDAARFLGCPVATFAHRDPRDLATRLKLLHSPARPILLTDGMFPHNGAVAPLQAYLKLLPRNSLVLLDDAHGAGTLGASGRGVVEVERVSTGRIVQCLTLSKAFGAYGGAVLTSGELREKIIQRSGMFIGSTPLPLPLATAALEAVKILEDKPRLRRRLNANVQYVREALHRNGHTAAEPLSPIFPITPRDRAEARALEQACLRHGVFPSHIRYPGGPESGYFRFVVSSEHTADQLDALVAAVAEALGSR